MSSLTVAARLVYIGLWCVSDDAGFFEMKVPEIGAALFRYEPKRAREKRVLEAIALLVEKGRVKLESCGEHAIIPTLPEWRYNAGVQIFTLQKKHAEICLADVSTMPLGLEIPKPSRSRKPTSDTSLSESSSDSVSESESLGMEKAPKRARNGSANGHAEKSGSKDPDEERAAAIARARQRLEDPATSTDVKRAAHDQLTRLGAL